MKSNVAVLDDYQHAALKMADWTNVLSRADVAVFDDHLADPDAVIRRLRPFDALCVMRERTPLAGGILRALPKLKLIVSTGPRNASIDTAAADELGITVKNTGYSSNPTIEFTWALILALARHLVDEANGMRNGRWQQHVGMGLSGKVLGVVGLGHVGGAVARVATAFGMRVVAWSQNMTTEIAKAAGAEFVSKDELFKQADIVTLHVILSARTEGLVGQAELQAMKPTALLVNASRGPVVDETALIEALTSKSIAGAAIDVFDEEPLPTDHPFRRLENVLATPHVGFVADDQYHSFYGDTVSALESWLDQRVAAD